jgi:hypothetical protein
MRQRRVFTHLILDEGSTEKNPMEKKEEEEEERVAPNRFDRRLIIERK